MKEVRGIKNFSMTAIFLNGALLVLFLVLLLIVSPMSNPQGSDIAGMATAVLGFVLSILYPAHLLSIRKNYYSARLPSTSSKVFLHIFRIAQLLFTSALAFLAAAAGSEMYRNLQYNFSRNPNRWSLQIGLFLAMGATIVVNLTIFFKGWRLLRMVRKNYVDHVMESFD